MATPFRRDPVQPQRISVDLSWHLEARCRTEDPTIFFHPEHERGCARVHREELAKKICSSCPVIGACRSYSLTFREAYGTWGGVSENERNRLLGRRRG
jgi:WhiB family redox-sensing transcriptional regulator